MLFRSDAVPLDLGDDPIGGHVPAQVQDPEVIVLQDDLHDVLADIMDVPVHRRQRLMLYLPQDLVLEEKL